MLSKRRSRRRLPRASGPFAPRVLRGRRKCSTSPNPDRNYVDLLLIPLIYFEGHAERRVPPFILEPQNWVLGPSYVDLMLFAVVAKAAKQFSTSKRAITYDMESKEWKSLTQETVRFIYDDYRKEATLYKKKQRKQLTIANYFKTPYYASRLNERPIPKAVSKPAKAIFG
jgi:hypothetical protein